jgi:CRP/FNR family transcriptional regulator, cyclic AMP receptor protein
VKSSRRTDVDERVLDLDPDLGADVDAADWEAASEACRGTVLHVARGPWTPAAAVGNGAGFHAFVIVQGMVSREASLEDRHLVELLGPNDVLIPPLEGDPPFGANTHITVLHDTVVMHLGDGFVHAAARWPALLGALQRRQEAQRERLAVQALIAQLARADRRLLVLLWHLAETWGRVTPEGVVVPMTLTHAQLGQFIAAQRSTVTLAVQDLTERGDIRRLDDGGWVLTPASRPKLDRLLRSDRAPIGPQLMLHQRASEAAHAARTVRAEARPASAASRHGTSRQP